MNPKNIKWCAITLCIAMTLFIGYTQYMKTHIVDERPLVLLQQNDTGILSIHLTMSDPVAKTLVIDHSFNLIREHIAIQALAYQGALDSETFAYMVYCKAKMDALEEAGLKEWKGYNKALGIMKKNLEIGLDLKG